MDSNLKSISESLVKRYSDRYKIHGHSIGTLGWGSKEQQQYRFSVSSSLIPDFKGKEILDIGCGFGDYFSFLDENGLEFQKYIGVDINEDLIFEATKNIKNSKASFIVKNLLTDDISDFPKVDIAFMVGVLNFNFKDKISNLDYTKNFLRKAFSLVRESLVFDFISTEVNENYPKEDFIYYHNPAEVLNFCLELSPFVSMLHDYKSIPQRECTVVLSKRERLI